MAVRIWVLRPLIIPEAWPRTRQHARKADMVHLRHILQPLEARRRGDSAWLLATSLLGEGWRVVSAALS